MPLISPPRLLVVTGRHLTEAPKARGFPFFGESLFVTGLSTARRPLVTSNRAAHSYHGSLALV